MAVAANKGSSGARSEPTSTGPKLSRPTLRKLSLTGVQKTNMHNSETPG